MIIITLDESLDAQSVKVYTGTKSDAEVTGAVKQVAEERDPCKSYTINHIGTPTKLDITCTKSNPNCIQVGGILYCW